MRRRSLPLVDRLRVRTPCDVGWQNMDARGRDRHCARCDLVVHDVASMTRSEVEDLLEARERGERVCLHLHVRRSDGAVLVADGHVTRAHALRSPPSRAIAAALGTMTAMTAACSSTSGPVEAPVAIAVGSATAPAPVIETPPSIEVPAAPIPTMPAPARPSTKIAAPPPKPTKAPKKHYAEIDGDAW